MLFIILGIVALSIFTAFISIIVAKRCQTKSGTQLIIGEVSNNHIGLDDVKHGNASRDIDVIIDRATSILNTKYRNFDPNKFCDNCNIDED